MAENARNRVNAATTAFTVVDGLKQLEGAGVTELSDYLEIPKSTVHSYLSTLEREGYVVKDGGEYHVGVRFLEYGASARRRADIYEAAKPEVDRLAEETGNLANLMVEEHGWGIYLHRGMGERAVRPIDTQVGTRVHLHSTAMGKAILAHLPEGRVEAIVEERGLPQMTRRTVTDREELAAELEAIRERGYAIDDGELVEGLRCVGAPVLGDAGHVFGAVSVAGPARRFDGSYLVEEMPERVMEAANVVTLNLTYS
ncbi:IclR family transcriptional regulator [Natronorarus salvus]|uniref:IclR family transcriptional regulator n=1 Tax=Natronorarus salvus TaxID=3117733 RepID=UPI002F269BB9